MTNATDYATHVKATNDRLTLAIKTGATVAVQNLNLGVAQVQAELASAAATMVLADAQKTYTDALVKAISLVDEGADGGNP